MPKQFRQEEHTSRPPTPPRWRGHDSLELVYQLNERAFMLLTGASVQRELWSELDGPAIRRAARFPFLVVDAHFTDEAWWRSVLLNPQRSNSNEMSSLWRTDAARQLMSETLVFAWHTVKWDKRVARLSLGITPSVAELIAALAPHQLDIISAERCRALQLRWQDVPEFWTRLLIAARDNDEESLVDSHLHAKPLLTGELIAKVAAA